jgi:hypothetical protein
MKGYAVTFDRQTFTPEGKADIPDLDAHNRALEASELSAWALCPDRFHCYITDSVAESFKVTTWLGTSLSITNYKATTWLGTPLGSIIRATSYRNNFGASIRHVTIHGTNGAFYHGSFGSDWSQFCRIRKMKGT